MADASTRARAHEKALLPAIDEAHDAYESVWHTDRSEEWGRFIGLCEAAARLDATDDDPYTVERRREVIGSARSRAEGRR